jgi:hypothetical protein
MTVTRILTDDQLADYPALVRPPAAPARPERNGIRQQRGRMIASR